MSAHRKPLPRRLVRPRGRRFNMGPFQVPHIGARLCRVFIPPDTGDERRPLLLMWDGQNIFGDSGSYAGGWYVDRAVAERAERGKPVPIVVGIDNGGNQRMRELSPWHRQGPLTEHLLDWVEAKLLPRLAAELPVSTRPRDVTVGGSSLGGLTSLYAHLQRPDTFGRVLAMSPSLWASGNHLFGLAKRARPRPYSRVYIDCGGREGQGAMAVLAGRMAKILELRGWDERRLMWRLVKSAEHHERFWRVRMPKALRFLYDTQ